MVSSDGDVRAAESQRDAMLDIKADAMDPLAAAEAVFEQAAQGRFYLLTQPDYVGSAMAERAEVLVSQQPPALRSGRRFDPAAPMRLDPDAAARVASFGAMSPMRVRGLAAVRDAIESAPHPDDMPSMANIEDCAIPGPAGQIPVRIYRPSTASVAPVLVYFHGGGMVMGSNHSFEPLARTLAAQSERHRGVRGLPARSRVPPHLPSSTTPTRPPNGLPANAEQMGVDVTRLAVVGDSAGGSLAAAVALAARDRGGPAICCQVLLYPGLDRDMTAESMVALPDAPMLSHDDIVYMHELADAGSGAPHDQYRVPAYATDLSGLPPAIVVTAECDPIRDWGERYATRLRDAGVQTTVTRYPGAYHGFLMRSDATARGRLAIAEVCALLRAKFDNPLTSSFPITGHLGPAADRCGHTIEPTKSVRRP